LLAAGGGVSPPRPPTGTWRHRWKPAGLDDLHRISIEHFDPQSGDGLADALDDAEHIGFANVWQESHELFTTGSEPFRVTVRRFW
jgi:hypothetical protein